MFSLAALTALWKPIAGAFAALAVFFYGRSTVNRGVPTKKISEVHDAIEKAKAGDPAGVDRVISEL